MIPAPEYWMNGTAARIATTMQVQMGVCRPGDTFDSGLENGSVLSRDIPKQSRIVAAMIDRQHTKIAAETTNRYSVANAVGKLAVMIFAGFQPSPPFAFIAPARPNGLPFSVLGMATRVPSRNTPPMMNAPITAYRTALGAARRGSLVSSESVDAVSKP